MNRLALLVQRATVRGFVLALAVTATVHAAPAPQDAAKPADAKAPPADVKVLQAVIMKVEGDRAQWHATVKDPWQDAKVDDVLSPGAEIRTGPKSKITLRIGKNATVLVDAQTRVALPEVVQDGAVLKTRVALKLGQADVKVDRVGGLENDLEVSTPSATLAVKGTGWRMRWDAVDGFSATGITTNELRAIEIDYARSMKVYLTSRDSSREARKLPAFEAFGRTYFLPLDGALTPEEIAYLDIYPSQLERVIVETGLDNLYATRGLEATILDVCRNQPNGGGQCNVTVERGDTRGASGAGR
ncbi:MAG: FecR domain-containing protein [Planctomycetes bacterium]|nr:FecR domain-containing protein [Planctomycetota bacterium]MBI3845906.1 FecR domain-containing protein [Planctomycetota bacterium]